VNSGVVPKGDTCPTTYDAYKKAPFPGQFSAECQKKWNAYAQDCTKQENFLSDNCKGPREALAKEMERQAQLRAEAAARAASAARASSNGSSSGGKGGGSGGTPASGSTAGQNCADPAQMTSDFCKNFFTAIQRAQLANQLNPGSFSSSEPARGPVTYICTITGQQAVPTLRNKSWKTISMTKPYIAYDGPDAKQKCTSWRSQINRLDDYRGFEITSVKRK
jgi:hypothetical protein